LVDGGRAVRRERATNHANRGVQHLGGLLIVTVGHLDFALDLSKWPGAGAAGA
jgi:hypothetical protein